MRPAIAAAVEVGTTIENVFEHAVRSADAIVRYFTERGFKVGMYVYNDGQKLFYPRGGEKQYRMLLRELAGLETHDEDEGLDNAVERCKGLILRYKPFTSVITEIRPGSHDSLLNGVRKLRAMTGSRRKRSAPVMVVNVLPYHLNPTPPSRYKRNAAVLESLSQGSAEMKLRGMGSSVLRWDPREESFSKVLLEQAGKG